MLTVPLLLGFVVVTVNVFESDPAATKTLAGGDARPGFELASVTSTPPPGAGPPSVTVPVKEVPPTTLPRLNDSVARVGEGALFTVNVVVFVTPP